MSTDRAAPIGIFDSGVGGLTVARAVLDRLPAERIRYIGDTAHAPYGPRPVEEIRACAMDVADSLVDSGVKLLVIACNTAASAGVRQLAERRYPVPVIEVISPAVRRALAVSRTRHVGVIGTEATIGSGAYLRAFAAADRVAGTHIAGADRASADGAGADGAGADGAGADGAVAGAGGTAERPAPVTVHQQACPSFVDFVERGITSGRQITGLAQAYLDPLQKRQIDTLILGCTHYPLLAGVLRQVMGNAVTLVSSADQTAQDVLAALIARDLLAPRSNIAGPADRLAESRAESRPESRPESPAESPGASPAESRPESGDESPGESPAERPGDSSADSPAESRHQFLATGDQAAFDRLRHRFLGPEISVGS